MEDMPTPAARDPQPPDGPASSSPAFRLWRTSADGRHPLLNVETYDRLVWRCLKERSALGLGHECQVWVPFALSAALDGMWRDRGYEVELVAFDEATEMALLYFVRAGTCASPPNP